MAIVPRRGADASGVSAVYSFFDPQDPRRGLGTYMILWLADAAARRGLPYVYLGYWIRNCRERKVFVTASAKTGCAPR